MLKSESETNDSKILSRCKETNKERGVLDLTFRDLMDDYADEKLGIFYEKNEEMVEARHKLWEAQDEVASAEATLKEFVSCLSETIDYLLEAKDKLKGAEVNMVYVRDKKIQELEGLIELLNKNEIEIPESLIQN